MGGIRTYAVLGAALGVMACGAPAPPKTTSLRLEGLPPDAMVVVDEQMLGTLEMVRARGVALPPGKHFLTVQAQGYFPFDRILQVREGDAPIRLEIQLTRVPQ